MIRVLKVIFVRQQVLPILAKWDYVMVDTNVKRDKAMLEVPFAENQLIVRRTQPKLTVSRVIQSIVQIEVWSFH